MRRPCCSPSVLHTEHRSEGREGGSTLGGGLRFFCISDPNPTLSLILGELGRRGMEELVGVFSCWLVPDPITSGLQKASNNVDLQQEV